MKKFRGSRKLCSLRALWIEVLKGTGDVEKGEWVLMQHSVRLISAGSPCINMCQSAGEEHTEVGD